MDEAKFDACNDPSVGQNRVRPTTERESRPFLGINFECCKTYGRIYRNEAQTAYTGQCPKCFARVTVPIGGGGTSSRFFNAR